MLPLAPTGPFFAAFGIGGSSFPALAS
jgi:hypothetical protein